MDENTLKEMDKEVRRLRRIASEWAGQLHDLVEDRLPAAYLDLPGISQSTFDACRAWEEAQKRLTLAQQEQASASTPHSL